MTKAKKDTSAVDSTTTTIDKTELDKTTLEQASTETTDQLNEAATQERTLRDAEAEAMAQALGMGELEDGQEADFDPETIQNLSPEQEAQVLKGTQDMLQTVEGAEMAAIGAINWYEELLQEHGHERFTISDKKKSNGAKRLTPVIQKYAPEMLGLFGQYKNEVMAALFVGSMTYGSVKQIRALKAEDLAEDKRLHPEKYTKATAAQAAAEPNSVHVSEQPASPQQQTTQTEQQTPLTNEAA
jgi:hypothetical protein